MLKNLFGSDVEIGEDSLYLDDLFPFSKEALVDILGKWLVGFMVAKNVDVVKFVRDLENWLDEY